MTAEHLFSIFPSCQRGGCLAFDPGSTVAITETAERAARAETEHMLAIFWTRRLVVCVDAIKAQTFCRTAARALI